MRHILTIPILFSLAACAPAASFTTTPKTAAAAESGGAVRQGRSEEVAIASIIRGFRRGDRRDYKIRPTDLLEFTVYREKEMDRTLRVSRQGTISFPLVGEIAIAGLSVQEAQRVFEERLEEFLVNPQITIFVKEYGEKQVYVLGEVKNPGTYELHPEKSLTVVEAISMAGGFSEVAAKDRTRVVRALEDGSNRTFMIEVSAIMMRGEKEKDLPLEPNDVIYVPQSLF